MTADTVSELFDHNQTLLVTPEGLELAQTCKQYGATLRPHNHPEDPFLYDFQDGSTIYIEKDYWGIIPSRRDTLYPYEQDEVFDLCDIDSEIFDEIFEIEEYEDIDIDNYDFEQAEEATEYEEIEEIVHQRGHLKLW